MDVLKKKILKSMVMEKMYSPAWLGSPNLGELLDVLWAERVEESDASTDG